MWLVADAYKPIFQMLRLPAPAQLHPARFFYFVLTTRV